MIHASQLFNEIKDDWLFNDFFNLKQPVYEWLPNIQLALKAFFEKIFKIFFRSVILTKLDKKALKRQYSATFSRLSFVLLIIQSNN